jgi:hypothetical protein
MFQEDNKIIQVDPQDMWATVDLMGHRQTAGRICISPREGVGLLRVDVPQGEGTYRTEYYGLAAIHTIRVVSEEIARAFAAPVHEVRAYDTPIVTREEHQSIVREMTQVNNALRSKINELERRLTAVKGLPEPVDTDTEL